MCMESNNNNDTRWNKIILYFLYAYINFFNSLKSANFKGQNIWTIPQSNDRVIVYRERKKKGSFRITLDYGRQFYFLYVQKKIIETNLTVWRK